MEKIPSYETNSITLLIKKMQLTLSYNDWESVKT